MGWELAVNIALVHEFFCNLGGSDQVAATLHQLYPQAPIFTLLVSDRNKDAELLRGMDMRSSFVQRLPLARRWHEPYLPLFPAAIESFDLTGYDLVLSSSHVCAKGVIPAPEALHLCYCHTPARYAWDLAFLYLRRLNPLLRAYAAAVMHKLRVWDVTTSARVDHFIANSAFVAERIRRYYHRSAVVIHPPVDTRFFTLGEDDGDHFLVVSRLTAYKRIDLAIEAFNRLGLPLVIIGEGPERRRLQRSAGPNIEFLGAVPRSQVRDYMRTCRGLIYPGKEDFGITPVEAQATGRPVVAYGAGGALESVVDGVTGFFFDEQTTEALCEAVTSCAALSFDRAVIRQHAQQFDRDVFCRRITDFVQEKWEQHRQ
jgi:glycosyltransferase involved in cell wall biosynthesis